MYKIITYYFNKFQIKYELIYKKIFYEIIFSNFIILLSTTVTVVATFYGINFCRLLTKSFNVISMEEVLQRLLIELKFPLEEVLVSAYDTIRQQQNVIEFLKKNSSFSNENSK